MEYFNIEYSLDSEETGEVYPQAVFENPLKLEPNPVLRANQCFPGELPPDNIPPFNYFILQNEAKLTDLMRSSLRGNGFLISAKLRELLEKSNVTDYKFYDVKLYKKDVEIKDYYYFHSACCLSQFVDYPNSEFYIGDTSKNYIRDLDFVPQNLDDLENLQKQLPYGHELVCVDYFFLKPNFPFNLDFFRIGVFNFDFFITRRFKEKLEQNKITGLSILPMDDFIMTPNLA
ncbi:MAG: hypothetical protein JNM51_02060 [Bacteroidia bacterium]|nr:hypothetical protein [Bacteroidia bacterium]